MTKINSERMAARGVFSAQSLQCACQKVPTHVVMSPLEFMQRLAAPVPRPRLHLIRFDRLTAGRFHGVPAPNAKLRREIIPSPPDQATEPSTDHAQGAPPQRFDLFQTA